MFCVHIHGSKSTTFGLDSRFVKRRDILRVNRRILLRVGADECAILFMPKILGTSGEKRLNEAKG